MKHFFVYIALAILLFAYIGQNTIPQEFVGSARETIIAPAAMVATAAVMQPESDIAVEQAEPVEEILPTLGIVVKKTADSDTNRVITSIEKNIPDEQLNVHTSDSIGDPDLQLEILDKMISEGYSYLVVELYDADYTELILDKIGTAGIPALFFGEQPELAQLEEYTNLYFIGFDEASFVELLAEETAKIFYHPTVPINFLTTETDITYSTLTQTSIGSDEIWASYEELLTSYDITYTHAVDERIDAGTLDARESSRPMVAAGTELIIFDNSSNASDVLDYFYDPQYNWMKPRALMVITDYDDTTRQLMDEGEVIFALSKDYSQLGVFASEVMNMIITGEDIALDDNINKLNDREYLIDYNVERAYDDTELSQEDIDQYFS